MKLFAVLGLLLSLSASAASTVWQDLEAGESVLLAQPLALEGKRGDTVRIREGVAYTLDSILPLDGIDVLDYLFVPKSCSLPDLESNLTLVLPLGNAPNSKSEVGVYFNRGCALEVMVETKDLGRPSLFQGVAIRGRPVRRW
jgi:hypothetical protein